MVKGNMGKFKGQISFYSNSKDNFLLNVCVLLRRENIVPTPNPLLKISFANGLTKDKLEGAC
jgi:hypothetical protein